MALYFWYIDLSSYPPIETALLPLNFTYRVGSILICAMTQANQKCFLLSAWQEHDQISTVVNRNHDHLFDAVMGSLVDANENLTGRLLDSNCIDREEKREVDAESTSAGKTGKLLGFFSFGKRSTKKSTKQFERLLDAVAVTAARRIAINPVREQLNGRIRLDV